MSNGPLFLAVGKSGEVRPGRITTGAVYQILGRLQDAAKVKPFSPHDCRRSYITALLVAGNSIAVVQKLAGHASVNTTARYDRSDEDASGGPRRRCMCRSLDSLVCLSRCTAAGLTPSTLHRRQGVRLGVVTA